MWIFPALATTVGAAFSGLLVREWTRKRRPHMLAWGIALGMFAVASAAVAAGLGTDWSEWLYRVYYLFGAVLNVPVLALGTIYLLTSKNVADTCAVVVVLACISATVEMARTDITLGVTDWSGIPPGSEVVPASMRGLSRYYSFGGFFVVVGGALWSALRMSRGGRAELRGLALANVMIATGTFIVAVASGFARYGRGSVFAVGLAVGVSVMFAGFMRTRPPVRSPT